MTWAEVRQRPIELNASEPFEVAIVFAESSAEEAAALKALVPSADISASNNFGGAFTVTVFIDLAKDAIGKLLGHIQSRSGDKAKASFRFHIADGGKVVELEVSGEAANNVDALIDKILALRSGT